METLLENPALTKAHLTADKPNKIWPTLLIYDVPEEIEEDEILEALKEETTNLNLPAEWHKHIYKVGPKQPNLTNWVVELFPPAWKLLTNQNRIYFGWRFCRIDKYVSEVWTYC